MNETGQIAKALAEAQAEMKNATLNKVNPHFKSKYADLAAIRDAVIPVLAAHKIAVAQTFDLTDRGPVLITTLLHESGEIISSQCPIITGDKPGPQPFASGATYARRISLSAIAGISADEDDDGNAAQSTTPDKISADQKEELIRLIMETGTDTSKFLEYLRADSLDDLPATQFMQAKIALEKKAKQ